MNTHTKNFIRNSLLAALIFAPCAGRGAQAPNPRGTTSTVAPQRAEGREVKRTSTASASVAAGTSATAGAAGSATSRSATTRRSASSTPVSTVSRAAAMPQTARTATVTERSGVRKTVVPTAVLARPDTTSARAAASNVVRSAVSHVKAGNARSATNVSRAAMSRAATARATAVFDDVSKIGGGYATCRDSYATCMDQFCAKMNDTYRRCFCSERFTQFRDTESALDEAKTLLMRFEDNNLNAVDKTAAEVNAMYTATVGEQAIKNDTSGAAAILSEIGDLLSGKKKATPQNNNSSGSLGILTLDFSTDVDDIWGGGGDNSIFASSSSTKDMTTLEAKALYNEADKQCMSLMADNCENNAVLTMAKSSYSIMINQDCNAYEKKIDAQREAVQQTVRTAEKYLREARLEEYRTHNSADVNECITKVRDVIVSDVVCGEGYRRCLDAGTGAYVNTTTGEAIPSPRFFKLEELIRSDGTGDLLGQNAEYSTFLDGKRVFAASALDTCRDMADTVWTEFKRMAIIEISQSQRELIEEVKSNCVRTMKECYDEQGGALKDFDDTTAKAAGALSAYAAKALCKDQVSACAALYGNGSDCKFDDYGRLTNSTACGLAALTKYVDSVDNVRVAEGCAGAIDEYLKTLCTPTIKGQTYPWQCKTMATTLQNWTPADAKNNASTNLAAAIVNFAFENCTDPSAAQPTQYSALPLQTRTSIDKAIRDVAEELDYAMMDACEQLDGYWVSAGDESLYPVEAGTTPELTAFYSSVFGGTKNTNLGTCYENSTMLRCLDYNDDSDDATKNVATYDRARDECTFKTSWFESQCALLGNGYFENGVCYVADE